jgi:nucleotide-binding universal stress UspA family protein
MHRRIIVPLDGSAFAEAALPAATRMARQTGAHLELVMVHQPQLTGASPMAAMHLDARIRQHKIGYLTQQAERIAADSHLAATTAVLDGPVVSKLASHAQSRRAALVVMSTHGRTGISRFFLGSTADRLIRELRCPILLVNPTQTMSALPLGVGPRVLIPLDGSALAESILDQVDTVFPATTELELVRVVVPPVAVAPSFAVTWAPVLADVLEQELARADQYLQAVTARLRGQGSSVRAAVVTALSPAEAIASRAAERRCDVIALATRGAGGLERALLGSVADKVIRAAQVPVVVWNPPSGAATRVLDAEEARAETRGPRAAAS